MFFIFGFGNRKGGECKVYDSFGKGYAIFYVANSFSLFFIPIINLSKTFFVAVGGTDREITKEEYNEMKKTGKLLSRFESLSAQSETYSGNSQNGDEKYAGGICPVCKKELTPNFAFCPYCGQKRPKA